MFPWQRNYTLSGIKDKQLLEHPSDYYVTRLYVVQSRFRNTIINMWPQGMFMINTESSSIEEIMRKEQRNIRNA